MVYLALDIVILRSSKGCLKTSKTPFLNSGSSSKKSTPLWAKEISPGWGKLPPPTKATSLISYNVYILFKNKKFLTTGINN